MDTIRKIASFASGIEFLTWGIVAVCMGFKTIFPTKADQEFDRKLGERIFQESLARGDPDWIASFERTNTVHMSDEMRPVGIVPFVAGIFSVAISFAIFFAWWYFVIDPLILERIVFLYLSSTRF